MKKIKIASEDELIFKNFELTEVMTEKKHKPFKSLGLHLLLQNFLSEYGIYQSALTWLGDSNNDNFNGEKVMYVSIKLGEFPIQNELVLRQIYGWKNASVNIGLYSDKTASSSFIYNLQDYSCTFEGKRFESLKSLLSGVKEVEKSYTENYHVLEA